MTALAYGEAIRRIARAPEDSQRDYRQLIEVLGRPGTIGRIDLVDGVPAVISLAAGLADVDVSVAVLDEDWERPFFIATGATRAGLATAQHVIATQQLTVAQLTSLERGNALHPERGARIFAAVAGFDGNGDHARLVLSGPGIVDESTLLVDGIAADFFVALAEVNSEFPAGIELFLVAPDGRIAAIPRSSHITVGKGV